MHGLAACENEQARSVKIQAMHDQCIRVFGLNPLDQTILLVHTATGNGKQAARFVHDEQCGIGVDQIESLFGYCVVRS